MTIKKLKLLFTVPVIAVGLYGCGGDHSVSSGKDTAKNSYQVPKDTSRADSTGADSASMDNSASGGTKIPKPDTAKRKQ